MRMTRHPCRSLTCVVLIGLGLISTVRASDDSTWTIKYSTGAYARVLGSVTDDGYVDYVRLKQHHMDALTQYLDLIAEVGPSATPEQFVADASRLAYWVNAYNALMLKRWLDAGAGDPQILQTHPRVDDKTWFGAFTYRVDGREMSLGQIEFEGVFTVSKDPRIHTALVCGAQSCPPLHNVPYSSDPRTLDVQLESAARDWMQEFDGLYIDAAGQVWMSDVFRYFAKDFQNIGGMVGVIEAWVPDADLRKQGALDAARAGKIKYEKWNWTVNQTGLLIDRSKDLTTEHYEKHDKAVGP